MQKTELLTLCGALAPMLVGHHRALHRRPELSFREEETPRYIEEELTRLGIAHERVAERGVVGHVYGTGDGPCIAFRADFDALPVPEENETDYVSERPGVMHACGHDAHTAVLLGLAELAQAHRDTFRGELRLLFQFAEELPPGGAIAMIEAGCLDGVDRIYGLHVTEEYPAGTFGVRPGPYMSAPARFLVHLSGKGGHGSAPAFANDVISCGGELIGALNGIVSRSVPMHTPAVLSVCRLHAGNAYNILPAELELEGTTRAYDDETAELLGRRVREVSEGVAAAWGVRADVLYEPSYPVLLNDADCCKTVRRAAELLGAPCRDIDPSPVSEDFAWYLRRVPGAFFRAGIRDEARGIVHPLHSPRFDIDEAALPRALALFWQILLCEAGLSE